MELFLIVLVLLTTIGISNIINHFMPFIPVPLIQIFLGVSLAVIPLGIHIPMEPELFFVLFIAPLLFNDGKNVPREELWKLRKQIFLLALGLVLVTVLAIGYLAHGLIPSIPLPAAFALAAILSPTDVVAVSAMSRRVRMPKGIMHLLEGEGLMNDASGLVAFNFAVAATVTGVFSIVEASWSFLQIALGGFAGGAVLAYLIIRLRIFIRRLGMEDVTMHMLIQILTPFTIYLIIEHFHLSGILAVVAAGIVHAIERDHEKSPTYHLQVVSKSTWTVILYILNGLVFVLLGLQIPGVAGEIFRDPKFNNMQAITYTLIITASLFLLRFAWVYLSLWGSWKLDKKNLKKPTFRLIGITTISGVRGAVTLAGAFSIPYVLADGSPFPERSLILFIAAGVILMTLTTASILLPLLAKPEEENVENKRNRKEMAKAALIQTQEAAVRATREVISEENREAALAVISSYNHTLNQLRYEASEATSLELKKAESEIRMSALEAQSQYIARLIAEKRIDKETAYLSLEYIRRMEIAVTNQMKYRAMVLETLLKRIIYRITHIFLPNKKELRKVRTAKYRKQLQLKIDMAEVAIQSLRNGLTPQNKNTSHLVIGEYSELIADYKKARRGKSSQDFSRMERELQEKAFQAERDEIQNLYEKGEITKDVIRKIRQQINIRESYLMEKK